MSLLADTHAPLFERIATSGVISVVEISDADLVEPLAETLLEAGLTCVEVTLRTPAAQAALKRFAAYGSQLLVGAGTVLSVEQADQAIEAGAAFLVSPGLDHAVVEHCVTIGAPIIPGVCTPSEITAALSQGIGVMKFFPAQMSGGIAYLTAIAAPFRSVRFVPTGGITATIIGDFLAHPQVIACGGSWMVKEELLVARDFSRVRQLAAEAVACVGQARAGRSARLSRSS